jgi:hypothetical protein
MWSDNDIDNAFHRLDPPNPEPTSFPLDAWLRLETQLDKAVIERAVRRRVWQLFAAEVAVVALVALGWVLWPTRAASPTATAQTTKALSSPAPASSSLTGLTEAKKPRYKASPGTEPVPTAAAGTAPVALQSAAPTAAPLLATAPVGGAPAIGATAPRHAGRLAPRVLVTPTRPLLAPSLSSRHPHGRLRQQGNGEPVLPPATALAGSAATRQQNVYRAEERAGHAGRKTSVSQNAARTAGNSAARLATRGTQGSEPDLAAPGLRATAGQSPGQGGKAIAITPTATDELPVSDIAAGPASLTAAAALEPRTALLADTRPATLPTPLATVPVAEPLPQPEKPAQAQQPRFYIGLVGAPDVTTVKFASVESPLPNVGLTLEYRLTNRLRVNTGLLRSTKQYVARREDYDWGAYRYLVYQHDFKDVDGTCTVLDIPLNLRYDLLARPQHTVFGSIGLSSFFMQRERYTYDYEENNLYKAWTISAVNTNRHLLSILNFSVGYERRLGPHWSLQAEPYLKVPLAGVGAGKVKLTSAGVFLGAKYGF